MCVQNEDLNAAADLGPIDAREEDLELAYGLFFDASPVTSLCTTPTAFREFIPDPMTASAIHFSAHRPKIPSSILTTWYTSSFMGHFRFIPLPELTRARRPRSASTIGTLANTCRGCAVAGPRERAMGLLSRGQTARRC